MIAKCAVIVHFAFAKKVLSLELMATAVCQSTAVQEVLISTRPAAVVKVFKTLQFDKQKNIFCVLDIDECISSHRCKVNERCSNTNGSYYCKEIKCNKGYQLSYKTRLCEDIDECQVNHRCSITHDCINTRGSYHCEQKSCTKGFSFNVDRGACEDIDECSASPCGRNQQCLNFPGSYSCDCKFGFRKDSYDPKLCREIDECLEHPGKIETVHHKISLISQLNRNLPSNLPKHCRVLSMRLQKRLSDQQRWKNLQWHQWVWKI